MGAKYNLHAISEKDEFRFSLVRIIEDGFETIWRYCGMPATISVQDSVLSKVKDRKFGKMSNQDFLPTTETEIVAVYPEDMTKGSVTIYFESKYLICCGAIDLAKCEQIPKREFLNESAELLSKYPISILIGGEELELGSSAIDSLLRQPNAAEVSHEADFVRVIRCGDSHTA